MLLFFRDKITRTRLGRAEFLRLYPKSDPLLINLCGSLEFSVFLKRICQLWVGDAFTVHRPAGRGSYLAISSRQGKIAGDIHEKKSNGLSLS